MIDTDEYEGHTPGPWKTNPNDLGTWIDGSSNEGIATVHNYAPANRANCELIAAAPDLLAFYLRIKEIMDMEEIEEIVRVELIWTVMQGMIE